MTSRSRQAVSNIVEDMDVVVIEHLYRDHAIMLLKRKLGWDAEFPEDEAEKLTEALGFMPLAIVQAATFIKQRAPRMSLSQYLEALSEATRIKSTFFAMKRSCSTQYSGDLRTMELKIWASIRQTFRWNSNPA